MDLETFFGAVRDGDVAKINSAITDHPDWVNSKDSRGYTPLILAAYYDRKEVVALLLQKGARVRDKDGTGNSALMGACFKGYEEVVALLLEAGADVNERNAMGGQATSDHDLRHAQRDS